MSKDLIIVESPAKVKTIKKFLGPQYDVEASVGHIRDLPSKNLGVDEKHGFTPQYQIIPGKQKVVTRLKNSAQQANTVFLAPDPDREGEAIAWHVAFLIKEKNSNIRRIQFNEITARAVKDALQHPRQLNEDLFNSQQARRILDRLVGYKISPLLWQKVKRGISAGRVQSVALRLIVEREKERYAFKSQEYWLFKVKLQAQQPPAFESELWKVKSKKPEIANKEQAESLEKDVRAASFVVDKVEEKERLRHPKPPFITSTLQQDASNRLNYPSKKTMSLAQKLYEGLELGEKGTTALITYMRTDSVRIAQEARNAAKDWIVQNLGPDYYPEKPRYFKSKGSAQDAHEAIRPVDVHITPEQVKPYLDRDLYRLYKLIWERFVGSQMAAARLWDTVVISKADYTLWRARGERIIFPGFLKIYAGDTSSQEVFLPVLKQGQDLNLLDLSKEQKFTQPPARYSEASLVRKLEEQGIGRPSTYAQIISTLLDRYYVYQEKKLFVPTELGITVSDLLVAHFEKLMDVGFTADMEQALDSVAEGNQDFNDLLQKFTAEFYPTLDKATEEMKLVKAGKQTGLQCEQCSKEMVIKFGRNGAFLACSGYPQCTNTKDFIRDEDGQIQIVAKETPKLEKVGTCPKCGGDLVVKKARTGSRFIACSKYPDCKYTQSISTGVPCPAEDCPGELVEKSSKRGKVFYACNQYPECKTALWDWPVAKTCPKCAYPVLVRKNTKARGEHLACPQKNCSYWHKLENAQVNNEEEQANNKEE